MHFPDTLPQCVSSFFLDPLLKRLCEQPFHLWMSNQIFYRNIREKKPSENINKNWKGQKLFTLHCPEQEGNKENQKKSSKSIPRKSIKTRIPHSLSSPGGGSSEAAIPCRQGWQLLQGSASATTI